MNLTELEFTIVAMVAALVFCLIAWAGRSNWKKRRHDRKQRQASRVFDKLASIEHAGQKLVYLRKIDPLVFEELILEAFERRGHQVFRSASYSGDGGIDGRVIVNGIKYLIQSKRYSRHVSKQHVLDFARILERHQTRGFFCHTGRTGAFSKAFHKAHPYLTIISGQRLIDLVTLPKVDELEQRASHSEARGS